MSLAEVKEAITPLSFGERAALNHFLFGWEDAALGKQMATDIDAGRLDEMISRTKKEMKAGQFRELP